MPAPSTLDDGRELRVHWLPAQLTTSSLTACHQDSRVPRTPGRNFVRDLAADDCSRCFDDCLHRKPGSIAKVECMSTRVPVQIPQGKLMGLRKVVHVHVVAYASAV